MTTRLLFWLLHIVVFTISLLPFWVLYGLSNLLYLLLYHVFGYRKAVVRKNLRLAFPDKGEKALKKIEEDFYLHFCDLLVEAVKIYSLSDAGLAERVVLADSPIIEEVKSAQKGSIMLGSHQANFEWMTARLDLFVASSLPTYAVYTPFRNKAFDRLMRRLREKRGLHMLPMQKALSAALRKLQEPCLFGMIVDQSPHRGNRLYFTSFLNQATPFHTSFAKIAIRTQTPLYFVHMQKRGRGQYQLRLQKIEIEDFLPETKANIQALTDHYARLLEEDINQEPATWLWSHRRWKHQIRKGDMLSNSL
ncbi:MAG: lysophospholipid acyltransferase family protein [Bacteroidota bacterium]